MEVRVGKTTLRLVTGDITRHQADAIVNAANQSLRGGGGVDGAIHIAGGPAILVECVRIGGCRTGDAVSTTAGFLPARRVIHTVGPVWRGGGSNEEDLLASCYRRSLEIADSESLSSIAFPSISTGIYGFPIERAAPIALRTVKAYVEGKTKIREVAFVLFTQSDRGVYEKALAALS
jgi:O-acetyl-ADP-ribose deacetylase (regulator of RNase III)